MKNIIVAACAVSLAVLTGCKTIPDTGTMYVTSYAVGLSAGLIVNQTSIDDTARNAVVDIMNIVKDCIPETNQTFEAAWTPIAQAHTDKLVAEGKLTEKQGELVMAGFAVAVKGIDYLFEERFPEAKQYKDLTVAAADGFINGFLTVFKPVNTVCAASCVYDYDARAYDWLNEWLKNGGK